MYMYRPHVGKIQKIWLTWLDVIEFNVECARTWGFLLQEIRLRYDRVDASRQCVPMVRARLRTVDFSIDMT